MSLRVVRAIGLITVQDHGRPGRMHMGLAAGGAVVREWLALANRRVDNPDDAAGIEVMGELTVVAEAPVRVATEREPARVLQPGDELTVASREVRVSYLAVHGGIDAPVMLGSRSTQLSAGIGTLIRTGATLELQRVADARLDRHPPPGRERRPALGPDAWFPDSGAGPSVVAVVPGPDLDAFAPGAIEALASSVWIVSAECSRVGTRLDGPPLPRRAAGEATRPMVCGAIEVPADGRPIVLGPEHPTTGGYPVIGVVAHADLGTFFATGVGQPVRFSVRAAPSVSATPQSPSHHR